MVNNGNFILHTKAKELAFEAEAKHLAFKVKAKDITGRPHNTSRPRPCNRELQLLTPSATVTKQNSIHLWLHNSLDFRLFTKLCLLRFFVNFFTDPFTNVFQTWLFFLTQPEYSSCCKWGYPPPQTRFSHYCTKTAWNFFERFRDFS